MDATQADTYVVVAITNDGAVTTFGPYPNAHLARTHVNRLRRFDREHDWQDDIRYVVSPVIRDPNA
jgi:hypothetical protein